MPAYDDVIHGRAKGVTCRILLNDRPNTANVMDSDAFDACIAQLGAHVLAILGTFPAGRRVTRLTLGKTYVNKHARLRRPFSPSDPASWTLTGPLNRWNKKYKPDYDGLIVLHCFGRDDIPPGLRAHKATQDRLALDYETHLSEWLKGRPETRDFLANADNGGGGRSGTTLHAGYVLYLAFKCDV